MQREYGYSIPSIDLPKIKEEPAHEADNTISNGQSSPGYISSNLYRQSPQLKSVDCGVQVNDQDFLPSEVGVQAGEPFFLSRVLELPPIPFTHSNFRYLLQCALPLRRPSSRPSAPEIGANKPTSKLVEECRQTMRAKLQINFKSGSSKERRNIDKHIVRYVLKLFEAAPNHKLAELVKDSINSAKCNRVREFLNELRGLEITKTYNKKQNRLYSRIISLMLVDDTLIHLLHHAVNLKIKEINEGKIGRINSHNIALYKDTLSDYKEYIESKILGDARFTLFTRGGFVSHNREMSGCLTKEMTV